MQKDLCISCSNDSVAGIPMWSGAQRNTEMMRKPAERARYGKPQGSALG